MKNILLYFTLMLLLSCKPQQKAQHVSISDIEWRLVKMQGEDLSTRNPPLTLSLNGSQKKVSGHAGCNRFFGAYESDNLSTITFKGFGSTKMYCQDKMSTEETYFRTLEKVQSFKFEGDKLLMLSDGEVILEFTK